MRRAFGWFCAIAVLLPVSAGATTGLAWSWPAAGWRYQLLTRVNVPTLISMKAQENAEARVAQFQLEVVTRCAPTGEPAKSGWELRCDLEDIAVLATPVTPDAAPLAAIAREYDSRLTGAWVQVQFSSDGRIKNIDLEQVDKSDPRQAAIHETMRLMLARAFAPMELTLPKGGDDKGKGAWRTDNLLATAFPSSQGTMGSVQVAHQITATEGGIVALRASGKGVVSSGEMVVVAGQERPANTWEMVYDGEARFDVARGVLLERQYIADAQPTASSMASDGLAGMPYVQVARAVLLADGDKPTLSESGLLE